MKQIVVLCSSFPVIFIIAYVLPFSKYQRKGLGIYQEWQSKGVSMGLTKCCVNLCYCLSTKANKEGIHKFT